MGFFLINILYIYREKIILFIEFFKGYEDIGWLEYYV